MIEALPIFMCITIVVSDEKAARDNKMARKDKLKRSCSSGGIVIDTWLLLLHNGGSQDASPYKAL